MTLQEIDKYVFQKINSLSHSWVLDKAAVVVDLWYYFVIITLFIYDFNWMFIVKALLFAIFINSFLLKNIFKKTRISQNLDQVNIINKPIPEFLRNMDNYSFPSGSAAISAAITLILFTYGTYWGIFGVIMTLINGFQRLYTGAHLPSEVLGGWITGSLTSFIWMHLG